MELTQQQCKAMVALEWEPLRDKAALRSLSLRRVALAAPSLAPLAELLKSKGQLQALASVDSFSNTVNFANLQDNRKLEGYGYDYYNYGRSPYYSNGGMYNNGYRGGYANQARGMGYGGYGGYGGGRDAMSRMYGRGYGGYGGYGGGYGMGYGGYGMGYGNRAYVCHGRARTLLITSSAR